MELEEWLKDNNIKERVIEDLKLFLKKYKKESREDFDRLFQNMEYNKVKYVYHSAAYVINEMCVSDNKHHKYIVIIVRLEYDDFTFAEYNRSYDFYGKVIDEYLTLV